MGVCCCVEPRSYRFQGHSGMVRGFFAATHYDADLDISISVSVASNDDTLDPHRIWWDVHGNIGRLSGWVEEAVICAIVAGVLLMCLLCRCLPSQKCLRAGQGQQARMIDPVATQSPPLLASSVSSSPNDLL